MKYEIRETPFGEVLIQITEDGVESFVPKDLSNKDYQAYLASIDEANTL